MFVLTFTCIISITEESMFTMKPSGIIKVPENYPTIQEAINAANPGDTVFVSPGIYNENLIIYKDNLTLLGENPKTTIIDTLFIGEGVFIVASNIHVSGFTIRHAHYGIHLYSAHNITLVQNIIANNTEYGVYIDFSSHCIVKRNSIVNNWQGIFLWHSNNNTFYHNNFVDNTIQVYAEASNNMWDNGCEGNFWSDYNGTDFNSDGVGDTYLPWQEVDNYPLMNLYWNPADINHDLRVDMKDVGRAARAFASYPGHPSWNPHADITGETILVPDGKVDMRDIAYIAKRFGESAS